MDLDTTDVPFEWGTASPHAFYDLHAGSQAVIPPSRAALVNTSRFTRGTDTARQRARMHRILPNIRYHRSTTHGHPPLRSDSAGDLR